MHPFDDNETMSLEVIDATLAGEAVEPEYADLAELTLILAGQRPVPGPAFAAALDDRVARRFARPAVGARPRACAGGGCSGPAPRLRHWPRSSRCSCFRRRWRKLVELEFGVRERPGQGERGIGRGQVRRRRGQRRKHAAKHGARRTDSAVAHRRAAASRASQRCR